MNLIMIKEKISRQRLEELFSQVVKEALSIGIPISKEISDIRINTRAKARFGCCKQEKRPLGKKRFIIEISERVLCAEEKIIRQIIAHELLHTANGCMNHGAKWKEYAEAMNSAFGYNITRTSTYEKLGLSSPEKVSRSESGYKYILKCQECGAEILRKKRCKVVDNPEHYRCGKCGGALKLQ